MDHQHDQLHAHDRSGRHDTARGGCCGSTFDRWRCDLPVGHDGAHRAGVGVARAEWNEQAAGLGLRGFARPVEHAERASRAAESG